MANLVNVVAGWRKLARSLLEAMGRLPPLGRPETTRAAEWQPLSVRHAEA